MTCSSELWSCFCACVFCSRARARLALGVRRADRVVHLQLQRPGREVGRERIAERAEEAALRLAEDRRREALAEVELRAGQARWRCS